MKGKEVELFFEEFNPDEDGKVSRSAILASYQARTGADLDIAVAAPSETTRLPPGQQGVDQLRGRRRRGRDLQQVPEQGGALLSTGIDGIGSIWRRETLASVSAVPAILATSRADRGAEVAGAAEGGARIGDCTEDRINLEAFRAIVDGASQPGTEDQEDLAVDMTRGIDQVESRTPPAMERNLFLSALANGKLEVIRIIMYSYVQVDTGRLYPRVRYREGSTAVGIGVYTVRGSVVFRMPTDPLPARSHA